jgi:hypothetical protein
VIGHRPWELRGLDDALRALRDADEVVASAQRRGRRHSLASAAERAASLLERRSGTTVDTGT